MGKSVDREERDLSISLTKFLLIRRNASRLKTFFLWIRTNLVCQSFCRCVGTGLTNFLLMRMDAYGIDDGAYGIDDGAYVADGEESITNFSGESTCPLDESFASLMSGPMYHNDADFRYVQISEEQKYIAKSDNCKKWISYSTLQLWNYLCSVALLMSLVLWVYALISHTVFCAYFKITSRRVRYSVGNNFETEATPVKLSNARLLQCLPEWVSFGRFTWLQGV